MDVAITPAPVASELIGSSTTGIELVGTLMIVFDSAVSDNGGDENALLAGNKVLEGVRCC